MFEVIRANENLQPRENSMRIREKASPINQRVAHNIDDPLMRVILLNNVFLRKITRSKRLKVYASSQILPFIVSFVRKIYE